MAKAKKPKNKNAHLITVGTTPPNQPTDVVDALIADLSANPIGFLMVLATTDSEPNARRLAEGCGCSKNHRIRLIESPNSLENAYQAVNAEIEALMELGYAPEQMILHYTAGTKVMSAGAVIAALNHEILSLRYLASMPNSAQSEPITTSPRGVLVDKQIRLAITLMRELRFSSVIEVLSQLDPQNMSEEQGDAIRTVRKLAHAYSDWDRFRPRCFLDLYKPIAESATRQTQLAPFLPGEKLLQTLEVIAESNDNNQLYPQELLLDLLNNAIRRLTERRPDDAMIRLHRAAELFAQSILHAEFSIRTDDVEIRKVPPRSRTYFEADRRLDDAKIKLGLRKSFELLDILGHPAGKASRGATAFGEALHKRRDLVLAHGTIPATMSQALEFYQVVEKLLKTEIKNLPKRAAAQQFPWIDNTAILKELKKKE